MLFGYQNTHWRYMIMIYDYSVLKRDCSNTQTVTDPKFKYINLVHSRN